MEPTKSLTIDSLSLIPKRIPDANKGTYGHVLVVAGSKGMSGAAYLSALSAYRSGAGLVKILTVEENLGILQTALPEAIISTYSDILFHEEKDIFIEQIKEVLTWASVIILGPGMGESDTSLCIVEQVLSEAYVPVIVDADALNLIAKNPRLTRYYTDNIIITPHLGEMSRLTKKTITEIKEDVKQVAIDYHEQYGITCVLKSDKTIIATKEDEIYVNTSGSAALAKAGSGDVLCGVIAGMLCLGLEDSLAATMGVFVHGLAGELAEKKIGEHSIIARDIISHLGTVINYEKRKSL